MSPEQVQALHDAIDALADAGDQDSVYILGLVNRLLADDWSGTDVYPALDNALSQAEAAA